MTTMLRRAGATVAVIAFAAAPASAAPGPYLDRPADSRPDGGVAPQVPVVRSDDGGFDWGDAAIGAGAGVAMLLVGVGGAASLSHRRRSRPGSRPLAS